jgi:sugar phosphate isomerase/epimerase
MTAASANPIAISTWSVHTLLQNLALEDLPGELVKHGFGRVEICHFHLANQTPAYLRGLGQRFRDHGVVVQTVLIDDGDLTSPARRDKDLAWIMGWIESAHHLGAENARVVAGKAAPTPEALALSIAGLKTCAALGQRLGVRVVTENWFDTLSTPQAVHEVLDGVGPALGFLADTGNWHGSGKYADLQSIFARAELCHAKTSFVDGLRLDHSDNGRWLAAAQAAQYRGPYTLIFSEARSQLADEWAGLAIERQFIADFSRHG